MNFFKNNKIVKVKYKLPLGDDSSGYGEKGSNKYFFKKVMYYKKIKDDLVQVDKEGNKIKKTIGFGWYPFGE